MKIQIATEKDIRPILELQKLAFYQRGVDYDNMNLKPLIETLEEYSLAFSEYTYLKATINKVLVGAIRANRANSTCYLSRLIVHPKYQRRGIGSKLILEVEKQFYDSVHRFELFTGETNKKSISLYKNVGYTYLRRSDEYEVPLVYLEKKCIHSNNFSFCVADISNDIHWNTIKDLVKEYFVWGNSISIEKHGFNFDIDRMLSEFLEELPKYIYPDGIMYLIEYKGEFIGIGGFKRSDNTECELKRMYIKENFRGNKLGSRLLNILIKTAEDYGYEGMKLESARFMINGYALYSSKGFKEVEIYDGVESPKEYQSIIYCMYKKLNPQNNH